MKLNSKIVLDENVFTQDDEAVRDESHFLSVKIDNMNKIASFEFSTNLAMYYFGKILLYFSIQEERISFLEFVPLDGCSIVNGVRLRLCSNRFFVDMNDSITKVNVSGDFLQIVPEDFTQVDFKFENNYTFDGYCFITIENKRCLFKFAKMLLSMALYYSNKELVFLNETGDKLVMMVENEKL